MGRGPLAAGLRHQGETIEELEINVKDAIAGCLAVSEEEFAHSHSAESEKYRILELTV